MRENSRINNFRKLAISLIILGWAACGYLFLRSSQLNDGPTTATDICRWLLGNSCDKALSDIASWQLGLPLSSWGMVYFGILGILLVIRKSVSDKIAFLFTSTGTGVSIMLGNLLLYENINCPLCLVIHGINLVNLTLTFLISRNHLIQPLESKMIFPKRLIIWLIPAVLLLLGGAFSELHIMQNYTGANEQVLAYQSFDDFQNEPVNDFSEQPANRLYGPANAPLKLVVFSSYQCPACQSFDRFLNKLNGLFSNKISIQYRHFPLSSTCNPGISMDMQPQSCSYALAAIAAARQGHFRQFHHSLFQSNLRPSDSMLISFAKVNGLNMEQWQLDWRSESTKASLAEDIRSGNERGIYATPTVFLNGRIVKRLDEIFFTKLLLEELKRHPDQEGF